MKIWQRFKIQNGDAIIKEYKLCGVTLLQKEKNLTKKKIRILGMNFSFQNKKNKVLWTKAAQTLKFTTFELLKEASAKLEFPIFNTVDVSIIIPVYNNYKYTKLCLQSILEHTDDVSYEIILADDASTDNTKDIQNEVSNIKISRNETNLRFLKNCNKASKLAKGKYILFLNNDTQVQKGWLSELVKKMDNDSTIGLVGSKLIYPDGTLQEAGGIVFADASCANYGKYDDSDNPCYNYVKEVDYISGASIMLTNELWQELGGFDELFAPAYYEDTDLAFRIRYGLGLKVVYVPTSVVVHFEGKSNGTDLSTGQKHYQEINREKFYQKWKNELHKYHVNRSLGVYLSRERGQVKKNILVIDWKILTFDKDTGSRTTWQYMDFFQKMGMNVKLFPHDSTIEGDYLQQHLYKGIEVIFSDFATYISQYGKYFDYIYLNRPNVACFYIDYLRQYTNAKIIYQCHDLHYLRQYRTRIIQNDSHAESMYKREKEFEFDLFKKMDVTCSFSKDEVAEIEKEDLYINAAQIPLYILDEKYMDKYSYTANQREDIMFVAGFSHIPNVDAAKWFVKDVFPKIKEKNKNIKLYLVGSKPSYDILSLKSKDIIVTGFVTEEELENLYAKIKLVVCPLRTGAGVKGKIIEAIYHKVPVITTDIGIEGIDNRDALIDIANTPKEFADIVLKRYSDNVFLDMQTKKYAQWIKTHFSKQAVCAVFKDYIQWGAE